MAVKSDARLFRASRAVLVAGVLVGCSTTPPTPQESLAAESPPPLYGKHPGRMEGVRRGQVESEHPDGYDQDTHDGHDRAGSLSGAEAPMDVEDSFRPVTGDPGAGDGSHPNDADPEVGPGSHRGPVTRRGPPRVEHLDGFDREMYDYRDRTGRMETYAVDVQRIHWNGKDVDCVKGQALVTFAPGISESARKTMLLSRGFEIRNDMSPYAILIETPDFKNLQSSLEVLSHLPEVTHVAPNTVIRSPNL